MSYSRSTTVDSGPTGDTVVQAVLDLDTDLTAAFTHLNTHEALTTASHGLTSGEGDIVGTDALQTLTRKTITSPTITGTVTGSGMTLSGGTISGATITGAITASGATIASPTITGGTATNQTITTPTITGGTATNLVMTTPSIGTASGTNLTLSGLSASLPVFTSSNSTLTSKSVANTLTALGLPSDPLKADGTAGRVLRANTFTIADGTTTGIRVLGESAWNSIGEVWRDNILKGGSEGSWSLDAVGYDLSTSGILATPVGVIAATPYYNTTGTAINVLGRASAGALHLYFYNAASGAQIDLTTVCDSTKTLGVFCSYVAAF